MSRFFLVLAVSCGLPTSVSLAQSFHLWIDAPDTVAAGDSFNVAVYAELSGYEIEPGNAFTSFNVDQRATAGAHLVERFSEPSIPWGATFVGSIDDDGLSEVVGFQMVDPVLNPSGEINDDNPILLFSYLVTTVEGAFGEILLESRGPDAGRPRLEYWPYPSSVFGTLDPGVTLTLRNATVRVIPAPGGLTVVGLALTACRRRR